VENRPELVESFVNASVEGWYRYLNDPAETNVEITRLAPNQTPEQLAHSLDSVNSLGIVVSGDALELGIGAMTDARWRDISEQLKSLDLLDKSTDYTKAFTTRFIGTDAIKAMMAEYPEVARGAAN
tara:strand:+ start:4942 stop:5319 length:378 start_codon:yes stop_codon:yes gene_type:complete